MSGSQSIAARSVTRIRFRIEIHRGDQLLVSGKVVYVNADPVARKSAPLPEFLRKAIKAFEHTAPTESNSAPA